MRHIPDSWNHFIAAKLAEILACHAKSDIVFIQNQGVQSLALQSEGER